MKVISLRDYKNEELWNDLTHFLGVIISIIGIPFLFYFDKSEEEAKKYLSPMALSFWTENRKVSNQLLCEELGYKLIYKNYKVGLDNCLIKIK